MAPEEENWGRAFLTAVSIDSWLEKKKTHDGAEGLWRIHDKLYDLTVWARIHPGGKFWIDTSRGTDITEAFESHHLSIKAEPILQKYYIREAATSRNLSTTFSENGFYKTFKRKMLQKQLLTSREPSFALTFLNDSLAVAVFLTSLLGIKYRVTWTVVSGILLGILALSSHSFLHMKDNWRVKYFNLSLMSSREWRLRHVLGHHQHRNTILDPEIPVWRPFPGTINGSAKYMQIMLNLLLSPFMAHIQFLFRFLEVFAAKKLGFYNEDVVTFSLPLFLYLFSGFQLWEAFVSWNLTILLASFVFCLISSNFLTSDVEKKSEKYVKRGEEDFGIVQLSHSCDHPMDKISVFSFLNGYRGNILHYLCPTVNLGSFKKLVELYEETVDEFGITYRKSFNENLQNRMPRGHMFFS